MNLCRMTAWTELSDVQQQEEHLFDQAFAEIEKAMTKPRVPARSVDKMGRRVRNG